MLELDDAEPEVVKLGVTVSEVVGFGYAKTEVVELGVCCVSFIVRLFYLLSPTYAIWARRVVT